MSPAPVLDTRDPDLPSAYCVEHKVGMLLTKDTRTTDLELHIPATVSHEPGVEYRWPTNHGSVAVVFDPALGSQEFRVEEL